MYCNKTQSVTQHLRVFVFYIQISVWMYWMIYQDTPSTTLSEGSYAVYDTEHHHKHNVPSDNRSEILENNNRPGLF